jgi:tetratricopeptide (TPR) repeat protein
MPSVQNQPDRRALVLFAIVTICSSALYSQDPDRQESATIQGTVYDARNQPLGNATVSLEPQNQTQKFVSHTDSEGHYRFEMVPTGTYTLRASAPDLHEGKEGPIVIRAKETLSIALHLSAGLDNGAGKHGPASLEFSDEPKFTVAGVTDPSNLGGHGSDVVLRTKEALAKDTASLKHDEPGPAAAEPHGSNNIADVHAHRGDLAESEGHPLEAVEEYKRAAEMDPSEPNLFAWGAELLLHRAFEPAIEVFTKGRRLYPGSVRLLVGLSVATYSRGLNDQANRLFLEACDLDPKDPTPYLFLGRLQDSERVEPPGWTERLKRFVSLHPENALAHYYYSISLRKRSGQHQADSAAIEAELKKAVELDPHLGAAYLQLGILFSGQKEFPQAIDAFQKAIEVTPFPDEAHYRLAQVYRKTGEAEKARNEIEIFNKVSHQKTEAAERERHEIQQFVYTLKDQNASTPAPKPQ